MKNLKFLAGLTLIIGSWMVSDLVFANPDGPSVVAGDATVAGLGTSQVTIHQTTPQAILHWQQFNIAPNEVTQFIQPSAQSIALNRIFDANPSQILGQLQANGHVILLNPNGVLFGRDAQVNVNGLIASSLDLNNANFLNGQYQFGIEGGSALRGAVTNQGTIEAGTGGVYLFAPNVSNNGIIRSPEGQILLAAGATVFLSQRPDGNGFLWEVRNPTGEAANLGTLIADGGRVGLSGRTVRQAGLIQANSVREKNGRIELVATERVGIESGSRTLAQGGGEGLSAGGTVIARSDKGIGVTDFTSGSAIDISGGAAGGNGGSVELSGSRVTLGGFVQGSAQLGFQGGALLIDQNDFNVDQTEFDTVLQNQFGLADISLKSENSLSFTNVGADPALFAPSEGLTLRLLAGEDILFTETRIGGDFLSGTFSEFLPLWNLEARAGNRILLDGSSLIGNGGRIDLEATSGNIELRQGSNYSYLWAAVGGTLRLKAGGDLIAPHAFDRNFGWYSGIRLAPGFPGPEFEERQSHLEIDVAGDFKGGIVDGVPTGPGFLLSGGTANVAVGGSIGEQNNYAELTVGQGEMELSAGRNIYLGLVQDQGVVEGGTLTVDPENRIALSAGGNIHLKPRPSPLSLQNSLRRYYPASFEAAAAGSIFIEENLAFWPSLTGALLFDAGETIEGNLDQSGAVAQIRLPPADPALLIGRSVNESEIETFLRTPSGEGVGDHPAQRVRFATARGDIRGLYLNFNTPFLRKNVEVVSGNDLTQIIAAVSVLEGTEARFHADGNIDMTRPPGLTGGVSGFSFFGSGRAVVSAGGDINLADSNGIRYYLGPGDLDIAVGANLEMTESSITSYNGANISIHGLAGRGSAAGGRVNVGTNSGSGERPFGVYRGIITLRGGNIDIKATGDVDVNSSQVSTLGGGDIRIESIEGDINAGFGSADEVVRFSVAELVLVNGQPVFRPDGTPEVVFREVLVPGSGIFTFHDSDPNPLSSYPPPPEPVLPPPFEFTPEMERLQREMIKRSILGQDISTLEAAFKVEADLLSKAYQVEVDKAVAAAALRYEEIKAEHRKDWKLGDITLTAKEGSVVVPPAGIRGRKINIDAKTLDLQGGEVSGDVEVSVVNVVGTGGLTGPVTGNIGSNVVTSFSLPSIPSSGATGGASLGGLSGSTGSISAASSGSVSTASSAVATVQEKVVEQARAEEPSAASAEPAASSDDGNEKRTEHGREKRAGGKFRSLQIRRGVVIQVEVNDEQP